MKKQSVLIRRALLFTAIVLTAAIAVGLPTGLLLSRNAAVRAARQELLPEARLMAAAAQSGDGALHTSAELFGARSSGRSSVAWPSTAMVTIAWAGVWAKFSMRVNSCWRRLSRGSGRVEIVVTARLPVS